MRGDTDTLLGLLAVAPNLDILDDGENSALRIAVRDGHTKASHEQLFRTSPPGPLLTIMSDPLQGRWNPSTIPPSCRFF